MGLISWLKVTTIWPTVAAHLVAVHVGHRHVQQDQVYRLSGEQVQRCPAV
jgi:ribosomal protein S19